jgi:sugar O-acyltransferase (sialic acid O-acetyltransferase NeuD family)
MNDIIVIGGGGHAKSCIDIIEKNNNFKIAGIIEKPNFKNESVLGYEVLGDDSDLEKLIKFYKYAFIGIGQISDHLPRLKMYKKLTSIGYNLPKIISKDCLISKHAKVGEGSIVMNGSLINVNAEIGENCIINSKSLIEHDAKINNNCHISTGCIINGNVTVEPNTFIGSNTVVRESLTIGKNSVISFGSKVGSNLKANSFFKN